MDVPKFDEAVLFGKSPLGVIIERICVQRSKRLDDAIFGEINEIIKENEHLTVVDLNEKAIVEALEKQIAQKIDNIPEGDLVAGCHRCGEINALWKPNGDRCSYCGNCGQKIDWSETDG
jgi:hypothetical protein